MTKKDYIIIATAIGQACAESDRSQAKTIDRVVEHVCHALQIDNANFDIARFKARIHYTTITMMKLPR
jgi:hypothetical protein